MLKHTGIFLFVNNDKYIFFLNHGTLHEIPMYTQYELYGTPYMGH